LTRSQRATASKPQREMAHRIAPKRSLLGIALEFG
jgi:hypothetical protein